MGRILGDTTAARLTERLSLGLTLNAAVAPAGAVTAVWLLAPTGSHALRALTPACGDAEHSG